VRQILKNQRAANLNLEFNVAGLTYPPKSLNCSGQIPSTGGRHGTSACPSIGMLVVLSNILLLKGGVFGGKVP
jgi:hypothetical protein